MPYLYQSCEGTIRGAAASTVQVKYGDVEFAGKRAAPPRTPHLRASALRAMLRLSTDWGRMQVYSEGV